VERKGKVSRLPYASRGSFNVASGGAAFPAMVRSN
jgi:hypothetical protein